MFWHHYRALISAVLLLALSNVAAATDYTWTATNGGSYQAAGNWSPTGTPGASDTVTFNANSTYTATL
jgi:hypothetical protein